MILSPLPKPLPWRPYKIAPYELLRALCVLLQSTISVQKQTYLVSHIVANCNFSVTLQELQRSRAIHRAAFFIIDRGIGCSLPNKTDTPPLAFEFRWPLTLTHTYARRADVTAAGRPRRRRRPSRGVRAERKGSPRAPSASADTHEAARVSHRPPQPTCPCPLYPTDTPHLTNLSLSSLPVTRLSR